MGGDASIASTAITAGTSTSLTVGTLPAYFKGSIGSAVIGVIGTTTTGGTLDTSGTSYYTATSYSGNTLNFASLPATWSSGGNIFLGCANSADAIAFGSAVTFANQSPALTLTANAPITMDWQYDLFAAAATPSYRFNAAYGGVNVWTSAGVGAPVAAVTGYGGHVKLTGTALSTTLLRTEADVTAPNNSTGNAAINTTAQPVAVTGGNKYTLSVYFSATGVASATYVSGGTFTGTGNCTLGAFNDSSTATGTIAVASGTPGAITITNRGQSATAAPTSVAQVNSCTGGAAWTSGAITITSTLGGAPGNMIFVANSKQGQ